MQVTPNLPAHTKQEYLQNDSAPNSAHYNNVHFSKSSPTNANTNQTTNNSQNLPIPPPAGGIIVGVGGPVSSVTVPSSTINSGCGVATHVPHSLPPPSPLPPSQSNHSLQTLSCTTSTLTSSSSIVFVGDPKLLSQNIQIKDEHSKMIIVNNNHNNHNINNNNNNIDNSNNTASAINNIINNNNSSSHALVTNNVSLPSLLQASCSSFSLHYFWDVF